jgi:hypothetical protein
LATGYSLGRISKVGRFAAALCVAIHTRSRKLFQSGASSTPSAIVTVSARLLRSSRDAVQLGDRLGWKLDICCVEILMQVLD